ncbi:MAG: response regulator [Candidatus Pacebacteria bacterium]|nr:response regulator [Candidatus Paceibacterota bacterium]
MDKQAPTILVVDDDADFLEQQKITLESAGYEVWTADSQKEAEELLEKQCPDAAVVDLMMEEADGGFALCYHIKQKHPDLPVIIVTAVASEAGLDFDAATDEERSWVKADAMLAKPVRPEQLYKELQRLLK